MLKPGIVRVGVRSLEGAKLTLFLQRSEVQGAIYEGSQKIRFPILFCHQITSPTEMPLYSIIIIIIIIIMWKNSKMK
jgi:hypothetical protein